MKPAVLFSIFFWFITKTQAQEYPYMSFSGEILSNHSYMSLYQVGSDLNSTDTVICHTDLETCCSASEGYHRGNWYFPDGVRLLFVYNSNSDVFERRRDRFVELRRDGDINVVSGVYRCDIPTNSTQEINSSVYIGLYVDGGIHHYRCEQYYVMISIFSGDISIKSGINVTMEESNGSLKFILTCVSTGGPATNVTWTRDSTTVTEGAETVLDDPVTAQYTHILTVSGRLAGVYICTVANSKPSEQVASVTLAGIYDYVTQF